jgi:hypothetical protein
VRHPQSQRPSVGFDAIEGPLAQLSDGRRTTGTVSNSVFPGEAHNGSLWRDCAYSLLARRG